MDRDNAQATGVFATTPLLQVKGVKWHIKSGTSMPTIANGLLFYSKSVSDPDHAILTAVDVESGKEVWSFRKATEVPSAKNNFARGQAYATGTIYFTDEEALYALEANSGRELWRALIKAPALGQHAEAGPLVVQGDTIYFTSQIHDYDQYYGSATLYAIDRASGKEKWRADLPTQSEGGVAAGPYMAIAADGTVFVSYAVEYECCTPVGFTVALDPATGKQKWQASLSGGLITSGGTLFVTTSPDTTSGQSRSYVTALDTQTGQVKWRHDFADTVRNPAALAGGLLYVSGDAGVHAIDAATGKEAWSTTFGTKEWRVAESPPTIADNVLYVSHTEATNALADKYEYVDALDLQTRKQLWSYKLEPEKSDTRWFYNAPVVADGVLYLSTQPDGPFYALH